MPLTYPTDNTADANQWRQGCNDGLNANPNHP
jgi:hypothetical protein